MEKKVYLLTLTCFSKLEKGVEHQITVAFDCDAEIAVFQRKEDAYEQMYGRVNMSKSCGWFVINSSDEVVEMVHDTYIWRKVYEITEKNVY